MTFDNADALARYKQAIWALLLANGGIRDAEAFNRYSSWERYDDVSYYGSSVETSHKLTLKAFEAIKKHGINWNSSTDPASHVAQCFNGTFTDSQLQVPYLKGFLTLNDGSVQCWLTNTSDDLPSSFVKILELITNADTIEVALEKLEERLTQPKAATYFSYNCKI